MTVPPLRHIRRVPAATTHAPASTASSPMLQPDAHFGRILAAYGGVFVARPLYPPGSS
jgi:drug/metabolite transporter superfamily protein YnfA